MSDPQTSWQPPPPRVPRGCAALILALLGLVMLVPGACAVLFIVGDPKVLRPDAGGTGEIWLFLAIGIGGVAMIAAAFRRLLRS